MKNSFLISVFTVIILLMSHNLYAVLADGPVHYAPDGLVPAPVERKTGEGVFMVCSGTQVVSSDEVDFELHRALEVPLMRSFPDVLRYPKPDLRNIVRLSIDKSIGLPSDGYVMEVEKDEVRITGMDRGGLYYGIQTFLQLLPPGIYNGEQLPERCGVQVQQIKDYPRFEYRGMSLDVARTFLEPDMVKQFIDRMARHKLNKLHWHLTDDEGWRIELESYPRLAEVGGFRGGDSPVQPIYGEWDRKYGGYYTQKEIRDIVAYAAARNVEIIPEIDLPGHSRAAGKVMPEILCGKRTRVGYEDRFNVWCAAREENYEILDAIIGEVSALFPSKYFHVGGDEVYAGFWRSCSECKALMSKQKITDAVGLNDYFMGRMTTILEKYGKIPVVWNEAAARGKLTENSLISGWETIQKCLDVTKDGYRTVIMPGEYFYFDMRQEADEDGATWAGRVDTEKVYSFTFSGNGFDAERMKNVAGVEGTFFSELLLMHDIPEYLDLMTYPRICALAEVGWRDEEDRNWEDFYERLTLSHFPRLGAMGIRYRLFAPETVYSRCTITARAPFEGVEIRYTSDGTEPTRESTLYTAPIQTSSPDKYLFRTFFEEAQSPPVIPAGIASHRVAGGKQESFAIDIADVIDSEGLWTLRFRTSDAKMRVNRIAVESPDTTYNIITSGWNVNEFHRMRYYAREKNLEGTITVTITNNNAFPCDVDVIFEKSPYIEPAVKFSSSLKANTRFPFKNIEDYNFTTYSRTGATCRKGDTFTYTFTEPVDAESIEVVTGLFYMPRYHVPFGRVQVSADGSTFTDMGTLEYGRATIYPQGEIIAVRIVSDSDGNSETAVALQDLRIKPREK